MWGSNHNKFSWCSSVHIFNEGWGCRISQASMFFHLPPALHIFPLWFPQNFLPISKLKTFPPQLPTVDPWKLPLLPLVRASPHFQGRRKIGNILHFCFHHQIVWDYEALLTTFSPCQERSDFYGSFVLFNKYALSAEFSCRKCKSHRYKRWKLVRKKWKENPDHRKVVTIRFKQ